MTDIQTVQLWRKAVLLVLGVILVILTLPFQAFPALEHPVEHLGLIAILICIVGRAWCSLYIGGRKKQELVQVGPYSLCRNPLYVFSIIGAVGFGAQTGSLMIGLLFGGLTWGVFRWVVVREEAFLAARFADTYADYCERAPRFVPDFSRWREATELTIRPELFRQTVIDGAFFLLALPLFESLEWLQQWVWASGLWRLP